MKKIVMIVLAGSLCAGVATAGPAAFSENFDALGTGNLHLIDGDNWTNPPHGHTSEEIYGGFPGVVITDSSNDGGVTYNGGPNTGQHYIGSGPSELSDNFERVSVDFLFASTPANSTLLHGVTLNYDPATAWGSNPEDSSAYVLGTNGDTLILTKRGRVAGQEYHEGPWTPIPGSLARDTWYTLELTNDAYTITGRVYPQGDPGTTVISDSFSDNGANTGGGHLTGGFPGFFTGGGPPAGWIPAQRDNFDYVRTPEPATMTMLGLGSLAMLRRKR